MGSSKKIQHKVTKAQGYFYFYKASLYLARCWLVASCNIHHSVGSCDFKRCMSFFISIFYLFSPRLLPESIHKTIERSLFYTLFYILADISVEIRHFIVYTVFTTTTLYPVGNENDIDF